MYKAAVRRMIRRNIEHLNRGDYGPVLEGFGEDATLAFPGNNSWSTMFRRAEVGREQHVTHRGRTELEAFLQRYVEKGLQMRVEDILVNGPPWNTRVAVRVVDWAAADDGTDLYCNRAVLFARAVWGKLVEQEDYEDTERITAFDRALADAA